MGIYLSRKYVEWIDVVKVLQKCSVVNSEGKILAVKRRSGAHVRPNKWDLPGGNLDPEDIANRSFKSGKGDDDDILVQAVKREVQEETGLKAAKGSMKSIHAASGFDENKKLLAIGIGYQCRVTDSKVKLSKEHQDFKWVTKEEFLQLDVGDDGGLIKGIVEKVK